MAISKIIGHINPPKSGWRYKVLQNVINYILNPKKTSGGILTGSVNCSLNNALHDIIATKEYYGKTSSNPSERLGYHYVISFPPNSNIDETTAYAVLKEFVEKYLGQEYEAIFALHNDQEHLHGHICFNSVRFTDGKKYRYNSDIPSRKIKGDWRTKIQPLLDQICLEHGINTLEMDTGVSIDDWTDKGPKKPRKNKKRKKNEYYSEKMTQYNKDDFIRHDIDDIILRVNSMDEFFEELLNRGYQYKLGNSEIYGQYLSVLPPTFPRYRKTYQLGDSYTLDAIEKRIKLKNKPFPMLPYGNMDYRFYIPIPLIRFQRAHYMKKTQVYPALKYYYAKLYRLGVKPRNEKSNYIRTKEILKEIRNLERQMELVYTNQINDNITCQQAMNKTEEKIQEKKEELNELSQQIKPYSIIIHAYNAILKLNSYAFLTVEQQENLQEYRKIIITSGKTEKEIGTYVETFKRKRKNIRSEMKQLQTDLQALEVVYNRFKAARGNSEDLVIENDFQEYQRAQLEYITQKAAHTKKVK